MAEPQLPFATSRCHGCRNLRRIESKRGSVFMMCEHPELPKYPPQPVARCGRFDALPPGPR